MTSAAKQLRWSRFVEPRSGRSLIVPLDHGLTHGPIAGLESVERIETWIGHRAITGVVAHPGMLERLSARGLLRGRGVMVQLNGMPAFDPDAHEKPVMTSAERAIRLGADAVSVQVVFDGVRDGTNLQQLGEAIDGAERFGLPVLVMLYDRLAGSGPSRTRHLMRACVELGCDAIKLPAPEDLAQIPALLDGVHEHTAVLFAGGELRGEEQLAELARATVANGGAGLCVGRNVFQRETPSSVLDRLEKILFERA